MSKTVAIVLAAGRGTRMKSDIPKVLHPVLGKPIIRYVLDALKAAGIGERETVVVAGYGSELLKRSTGCARVVLQKRLLGSADAVKSARRTLGRFSGEVIITCGDAPLIRGASIKALVRAHRRTKSALTVMTVRLAEPGSYGRIVRDGAGRVRRIVEAISASPDELRTDEINVGTYCCNARDLWWAIDRVRANAAKGEFFLTDIVEILSKAGRRVDAFVGSDAGEMIGINTRRDIASAGATLRACVIDELMSRGVTVEDPSTTTIYPGVKIGRDSVIYPHTVIESDVVIGRNCHVGPFSRLRPGTRLADGVEVGNFVELVRTCVGRGTKVKHHTYLGDTCVGRDVNIGAGTITANYDGSKKHKTVIGDETFIGVGAVLIAPVTIGRRAVVGAGAVVPKRHDVPAGSTVVGIPARLLGGR